jgi:Right handed beta helix region
MRKIAYAAPALLTAALAALLSGWSGANNATPTPTPTPNPGCNFFASPTGSDSNGGTSPANAFKTVSKLDSVLSAGKVGCLESGDYGDSSSLLQLYTGGASGSPATITADTGAHPVIHGAFRIYANNLTLSYIRWDENYPFESGRESAGCSSLSVDPLDIEASNVVFDHNDVSAANVRPDERGDGIGVAWNSTVSGVVITHNKIHDWGSCNQLDHGIYYDHASNGIIANNWIWDGPCSYGLGTPGSAGCGGGIQLYADPNNTQVYNNVVDGAGVGCFCAGSNANIYHNIFTNLRGVYCCSGGFRPGFVIDNSGTNNSFANNIWWNAPGGCPCAGNINADPQYVDAPNHNYAVKSSSPAASWGLWAG